VRAASLRMTPAGDLEHGFGARIRYKKADRIFYKEIFAHQARF